jgi:hypothetical protein
MALDFIPIWADAIAQFEGFNSPGSRPARDHNPGDLKFAGQRGAVGQDPGGFAVFPDDITGFQALYNQLTKYVSDFPGYSLLQIMAHYLGQHAPEVDAQGNAFTYADSVAAALGVTSDVTLGQLAAAPAASSDGTALDPGAAGGGAGPAPDSGQLLVWVVGGGILLFLVSRLVGGS